MLPATLLIVETMLGQSYTKELSKIPLAENTEGRISDISKGLCDKLTNQFKTSQFALQIDKTTDVIKDAHLITCVQYELENDIKENFWFCKPTDGTATSLEESNTINHFLGEIN
jgi:hypothetical protein